MESLRGYLTRIRYKSADFVVADFVPEGGGKSIVVVGPLPVAEPDEFIDIFGQEEETEKYGKQFSVVTAARVINDTPEGIGKYLEKEVPGIGPVKAKAIVDYFGEILSEVLSLYPGRLKEVPGIKEVTALRIIKAWKRDRIERQLAIFLARKGIGVCWTSKIYEVLGGSSISLITSNPYILTRIKGLGFKRVDEIAKKMGYPGGNHERLVAGFRYLLEEAENDGHVFVPREILIQRAVKLVGVTPEVAEKCLQELAFEGRVKAEEIQTPAGPAKLIYSPGMFVAETSIECNVKRLMQYTASQHLFNLPKLQHRKWAEAALREVEDKLGIFLTAGQKEAIQKSLTAPITILTGGPGTGKTKTVQALVLLAEKLGLSLILCAPTGRAARRLGEVSGHSAETIHRTLKYDPLTNKFGHSRFARLVADVVIVDEFSMVDIELAAQLLQAIDVGTSVLILGDPEQLPPVGPGCVLKSMLESGKITTVQLDHVFRQEENSLMVRNAYSIRKGETPTFPPPNAGDLSDTYFIDAPKGKEADVWAADMVKKLCQDSIPKKFKFDPKKQIQVLVPMKKGAAGVNALNETLRAVINPEGQPIKDLPRDIHIGDRVMQTVNNYELDVYNGDIGTVNGSNPEDKILTIDFYNREVQYPYEDTKELSLAYATTVHKSQGGEYDCVVLVLLRSHYIMLKRNLLYTAATRAKRLLIFVGNRSALEIAVRNTQSEKRNDLLAWRLTHGQPLPY
jgi:exodeoxyribonuclease V alpha subunit